MRERYDTEGHGIELVELGGGWQILTRPEYTETIERAQLAARPQRLSAAALETLAIIAYRQPIGRAEIEEIRGVGAGQMLKSLHERELIEVVGRGEGMGRPLLYGTTPGFLEQFALRHLGELPRADELAVALRDPNAPPQVLGQVVAVETAAEEVVEVPGLAETADAVDATESGAVTPEALDSIPESNDAAPDAESPYASTQT
jgi:segregation and condensation protein B